ncbi:hypothetical protein K458DRAFT_287466 [Lentithecium fluviatile CBS 122367]|uniref:F-box domain-containing protein n=1 Tax=Lentithecium fluviatile CBS 122367 TaxID=1168545 RepID=A0A6G1JL30_9PLEO|nr:hypothetical protein K458DRAFT_287466 [Lentithecium fluviatile CBS 122367]
MPPTLDTLPPEILFNILSYTSPFDASHAPLHPLYTTAATCRHLCSIVEEYSRSLLKRHVNITPPKAAKTNAFVCRKKWVRWVAGTCQLCGKKSRRTAILDPSLTCCQACDHSHFPKMTMTEAITTHYLSKLDLFTPNKLHPTLPPLLLGTYIFMGGDTLMLSEPSVLARKAHLHGLLGDKAADPAYLRRRVAAHDRLMKHMDIQHSVRLGRVRWVKRWNLPAVDRMDAEALKKVPKSLRSAEARAEYVRKGLGKEWEAMGLGELGAPEEQAIEIS